ncbi:MAG: 4-amino-4-deoxychorismate lyase [Clostridia bacterium]|jgi:4-amino-4-deoxychorismate lyase|nr:4-amino-4-deoxychorismate lyase [Clostridia bacterium]
MHFYYNDQLTEEVFLQPSCQGFQYGYGVFETILINNGIPCFVDMHYQRMVKGCYKLGLKLDLDMDKIYSRAIKLVEVLNITHGRLKLICFRDANRDSTLMTLSPYHREASYLEKGISLWISSIKRNPYSPICHIKSLNYMENILAKEEAKEQSYDEALFLNVHNKLCEGAVSNIFWVKDNRIYTPEIESGILAGITRGHIIEICSALKLKLEEGSYELAELLNADEAFVTNSLMGITPVGKVDKIIYNISGYKNTNMIYDAYKKLIDNEIRI